MTCESKSGFRGADWQTRVRLGRVALRLALVLLWSAVAGVAATAEEYESRGQDKPDAAALDQPEPSQREAPQETQKAPPAKPAVSTATSASICLLVESAARAHGLPFEFFGRLIWQESRFKPNAVGPVTRSGQRAQGVAQFMPGTARERGLFNMFDPVAALPKSAEFLGELRAEFGNLGLAAAAYNAGPQRLRDWIAGRGALPAETRNYVIAITRRSVDEWAATKSDPHDAPPARQISCAELMAMLTEQRSPFVGELERRISAGAARPWGVELSAGFARDRVLAIYAAVEKTYRAILQNQDPIIIAGRFRSRGTQTFYQARVGFDTRAAADKLCAALHKAGGACLVLRNSVGKS